jgi:ferric enterobactin receptor
VKTDRTPVRTVVSDSSGNFSLSIDTGKYFLLYTCAGYHPFRSNEIIVSGQLPLLEPVYLRRDSGQLAAVTVLGRRPVIERSADGFIYNAENDIAIAAGSAVDVLRKIPMLSITPDGAPSVRGSTNVRVFIDNKPSTVFANSIAEALQLVPSEEIARVEIITHPSAKYDAEGTDAVINIITKKRRYDGYNGNLRTIIGNWQQELTGTLKLRSGYWILNFDGGLYRSENESGNTLTRSANKIETANRLQQQREAESKQNVQLASLTVMRILDSLNTLNFGYRLRKMEGREMATQYSQLISADTIANSFYRDIPSNFGNNVHTFTGAYSGQSRDKERELNFMAAYFRHQGTDTYNLQQFRNELLDYREKSEGETGNRELTLQADFVNHFTKLSKLETGIKGVWRSTATENIFDIYNPSQQKYVRDEIRSNNFSYRRPVYAAYASYSHAIKKWQWRAGLRYEKTKTFANFKDTALKIPDLDNLLPNLLARYNFNEKHSLSYTYTSRIARPYIFYLNPNISFVDSLNISFGNPDLQPQITHQQILDYNYNNRKFFFGISLLYSRTKQAIEEYRRLRSDRIAETTWLNIGKASQWALNVTGRYSGSKITFGTTLTLQHVTSTSPSLNLSTSGFLGQISANASYRFGKGYSLESYIYYESRSINLQQTRTDYLFYNLLLTKKLLADKLIITIRADGFMDPWFYRTSTINTSSLYQAITNRSINRGFRLAISWKFGKQDLRTPVARTAESND